MKVSAFFRQTTVMWPEGNVARKTETRISALTQV